MKFNPFRSPKIKKHQKPAKVKIAGEKKPDDKNETAERVNRTVYLTVAVLLIVLAVAVAMTSAANRARKEQANDTTSPTETSSPETRPPTSDTKPSDDTTVAPPDTDAVDQPDTPAGSQIPTLSLPAKGILGNEHDPTVQVFSNTLGEWRVHLGIDIMTEEAAPVYAAASGKIKQIANDPMWGKCIWIEHSGDAVSIYRGLADELASGIEVGATVNEDTLLGAVGDGGVLELADEPHLHFELQIKGADADPLDYFSKSALETLSRTSETSIKD
ncbi:MAG: peptidoglycan DD-metalloendopeptidase family protein [Eubacteriales bacterium]